MLKPTVLRRASILFLLILLVLWPTAICRSTTDHPYWNLKLDLAQSSLGAVSYWTSRAALEMTVRHHPVVSTSWTLPMLLQYRGRVGASACSTELCGPAASITFRQSRAARTFFASLAQQVYPHQTTASAGLRLVHDPLAFSLQVSSVLQDWPWLHIYAGSLFAANPNWALGQGMHYQHGSFWIEHQVVRELSASQLRFQLLYSIQARDVNLSVTYQW